MLGRFLSYWLPIGLYAGLIFYLSSLSGSQIHLPPVANADKFAHLCEYGVFGALLVRAFAAGGSGLPVPQAVGAAWIVATLYGAGDEFHQFFVPTRACELGDLIADSIGGLSGAVAATWILRRLGRLTLPSTSTRAT